MTPDLHELFVGRVGIQQRILPTYRVQFFDELASKCERGLGVFAGQPRPSEGVVSAAALTKAEWKPAANRYYLRGGAYLCVQPEITDWLSVLDPDVLVVEANPRVLSTSRAISWMKARRRPCLGWGLGQLPVRAGLGWLQRRLRRFFLAKLDGVIAYSQFGASQFIAAGLPENRVFVAPNSVQPRPQTPPAERNGFQQGRPTLISVGRLSPNKRIDLLIDACARIPTDMRLVIVGDGPSMDELIEHAGKKFPQSEFVGHKDSEELQQLFDAADLFVLPGTGGLAIQDALTHGLPIIAAEGDGSQHDLVRKQNGWIVPPGDIDALVETIQSAISNVEQLREMGRESYRIARDEINRDEMIKGFVRAMQTVVRSGQ